jgi:hypothetical protein
MAFPNLVPSARSFAQGDFANRKYTAISGQETRIRYGDKKYGATLNLTYQNLSDDQANLFLAHYTEVLGTFKSFTLPAGTTRGWSSTSYIPNSSELRWRYEAAPTLTNNRPGVSSISLQLRGVI